MSSTSKSAPRLPDLCRDLFALALGLRTSRDPGSAEALQGTVARMLEQLSQHAREGGVDSAHLEAARYALCALIDEVVLGSRWECKNQWLQKPLQMAFFGDFTAGEQFYRRLDELRRDAAHNVDAIEVYALCLAGGFRGKYGDLAGMQKVDDLLAELTAETRAARGVQSRALSATFARSARSEVLPQAVRRVPPWVVAAAGAGFLLVLLFVLQAVLSSQASDFLATGKVGR